MYKKHIIHLISVSLKFFFDFDHNTFQQICSMSKLITCFFLVLITMTKEGLYDGLATVKHDIISFRSELQILNDRWINSGAYEIIVSNVKAIKSDLVEDTRNLRLRMETFRFVK